ncbi:nucleoside-diphosphate sugar epimerase/dehydratase [Litoribaculum gwangyangense]|uniref:Nucleoside-diphosphate sugar epimerase/dehydratase n=1 Tax=Litoribaculum gwangyangense TaxID=1130722 RepID=A0ABP9BZY9_9FLAO
MLKDRLVKIKETIKLFLRYTPFNFSFENIGYIPRWLVFWFDLQITAFVLILVGVIINNYSLSFLNKQFIPAFIVALSVTAICFIILKTYVGLIRHSSYIDAVKLFFASFCSAISLFLINFISFKVKGNFLYEHLYLILFFLGLFVGLFLFRGLVKLVYTQYLSKNPSGYEKVFVLGTSQNSISIAVAIENEFPKRFKVIGFLDRDEKIANKRIFGMPIFVLKRKAHVLIRANNATGLIVLENDLKNEENIRHIEDCLEHNLKIYRAPSISEFDLNEGINKRIQNIQIEDLLERKPIEINNNKILGLIEGKIIFVTGGAGSIGSEIVNQLGKYNPKKLVVIDQAETPLHNLTLKFENKFPELDFIPIICDVRNKERLDYLFKTFRPDIIYHCAAYKHVPMMEKNPSESVLVNILGTKILADLSAKYDVERFIMISTDKAVNPSNVMGATKRVAEMYVQSLHNYLRDKSKTKFITTRFGNVLGSNGSVVPLFKKQIQEGGPVTITHPDIIRYFMTIPEACQLVMEASTMGLGGEIFIFDMGKAVKILDLARKMILLAGFTPEKDIKIRAIGLRPGEKLYEELLNDKSITLPTYHEKIMIVKVNNDQYDFIEKQVNQIISASNENQSIKIVKRIKKLVPEYKSLNSSFEKLDT